VKSIYLINYYHTFIGNNPSRIYLLGHGVPLTIFTKSTTWVPVRPWPHQLPPPRCLAHTVLLFLHAYKSNRSSLSWISLSFYRILLTPFHILSFSLLNRSSPTLAVASQRRIILSLFVHNSYVWWRCSFKCLKMYNCTIDIT